MSAAATTAIPANSHRCQPELSARKLNAAPVLYASTKLKKGVTTTGSPDASTSLASHFVAWSARTTAAATIHQVVSRLRKAALTGLGMLARLPGPEEIGDAPAAERGMRAIGAHVRPIVPAAGALRMRARRHDDAFFAGRRRRLHGRPRGDEHEAQVVVEAAQELRFLAVRGDVDLGLERRADAAGLAQR